MARAHAIDALSQSRVEVVVFIVVSFPFVLVIADRPPMDLFRVGKAESGRPVFRAARRRYQS